MPIGTLKNRLYGLALPVLGKRCQWKKASGGELSAAIGGVLRRRHAVGVCVQRFEKGALTDVITAGYAVLEPQRREVEANTLFRAASIAKMVSALLVFRLQTLGKLDVREDVSDLLGYRVRNPYSPDAPITLGMLMSHTSGIVDSPAYYASFQDPVALSELLSRRETFWQGVPGVSFRYSNLAAGMVACALEARFQESFEVLAQRELFAPLNVSPTFDLSALAGRPVADSHRVLPPALGFCAKDRIEKAAPLAQPDAQRHYFPAAGGLFISAPDLARLALVACNGHEGFLNANALEQLRRPIAGWPEQAVRMRHGMGLLEIQDEGICPKPVWGHQGFAYGAVNGVFFDETGSGFAMLNSGASEQRAGHLALINRDLIKLLMCEG